MRMVREEIERRRVETVSDDTQFLPAQPRDKTLARVTSIPTTRRTGPDDFTISDVPKETADQAIARLAKLPRREYEQVRESEAKRLGWRRSMLDVEVTAARGSLEGCAVPGEQTKQGRALSIAAPEPWGEPVQGAALLADLAELFSRHLVLTAGAADALAAWALHTYVYKHARHTPRLAITSPEKGCGKTTVLDLLTLVSCKPVSTANISTAAVFRTIELTSPTLLVDEADTFLARNEEMRGVLNSGHKRGGKVIRCIGEDSEPREFNVFSPAAIAAIGRIPGTLVDRSIAITMRRAAPKERPQPIRAATEREGAMLARKAARWAVDCNIQIDADPQMPSLLANRGADNWRPIFAIAEAVGADWPQRLMEAALSLSSSDERDSLGVALLHDVQRVFVTAQAERLSTADIVKSLNEMEDRPWPEVCQGKAMTASRFSRMVKPYGAAREQWRDGHDKMAPRVWGYALASFNDAFTRYLPDGPAETGDTGDTLESLGVLARSEVVTRGPPSPVSSAENQQEINDVTRNTTFSASADPNTNGEDDTPLAPCSVCRCHAFWRLSVLSGGPGPWTCKTCTSPDSDDWIDAHVLPA
jgi:putative DNA primase/helicase